MGLADEPGALTGMPAFAAEQKKGRRTAAHANRYPSAFHDVSSNAFQAIPAEVFNFKEFVDPKVRSLSPQTTLLHAAEGRDFI